jgi:hypothetical protein
VEFFTSTDITAAGGQFDFDRCTGKMFVHRNRKCNFLAFLYLRGKYKKRERQYWIHPMLAVRYLEGSFYTLFEKLKSHDSKFLNYFRMSVLTPLRRLRTHTGKVGAGSDSCAGCSLNKCVYSQAAVPAGLTVRQISVPDLGAGLAAGLSVSMQVHWNLHSV